MEPLLILFSNMSELLLQRFLFLAFTIWWNVVTSLSSSQSEFTRVTNEGLKSFFLPLNFYTYSFDSLHGIDKCLHCSVVFALDLYFALCHQYTP